MRTQIAGLALVALAWASAWADEPLWEEQARAWGDLCERGPTLTREWACRQASLAGVSARVMRDALGQATGRELEERARLEQELCDGGLRRTDDPYPDITAGACREAVRLRARAAEGSARR